MNELPDGTNFVVKDQKIRCPETKKEVVLDKFVMTQFKNEILMSEKIYTTFLLYLDVLQCIMVYQKELPKKSKL